MCENISFQIACDVENLLLGPNGATMVYAPQKGANWMTLPLLEQRMELYAEKAQSLLKQFGGEFAARATHIATILGGGAAGGVELLFTAFSKQNFCPDGNCFQKCSPWKKK